MKAFLFAALWSLVFFTSCNSPQEDNDAIDYSSLEKLSGVLSLEIGESEDYIPGRITEIKVTNDGTIFVADLGNITIEQFNSEGEFIGTVARAGRGPGELSNIFTLNLLNGDTLIARNLTGRKDYFARTDGEKFEHINTTVQSEFTTRTLELLSPLFENRFYGIKRYRASAHEELEDPKPTIKEAFVVLDENGKLLKDSVHVLKRRGKFSVDVKGSGYLQTSFPFQIHEQAVPLENGNYLITRPDSNAFFIYNEDHSLERRIPVNVKKRPVTDEDLEYIYDGLPDKAISRIENMRSDIKPPYNKVYASSNYFWLQTISQMKGRNLLFWILTEHR